MKNTVFRKKITDFSEIEWVSHHNLFRGEKNYGTFESRLKKKCFTDFFEVAMTLFGNSLSIILDKCPLG